MNNLKLSINLNSSLPPGGFNPRGHSTGFALGLGQSLGLPAKANPLADVIGQTDPQGLQSYLGQPTQPKLTQPNFVLNPRVGKLRHTSPLLIDGLSFRRLHLCLKCYDLWRRFAPYQRSASLRPRATLRLKLTYPTLRSLGPVTTPQRRCLPLPSFISQHLARGTSVTVSTPILLKGLRVKIRTHSTLPQTIDWSSVSLRQGPNQTHLLLAHLSYPALQKCGIQSQSTVRALQENLRSDPAVERTPNAGAMDGRSTAQTSNASSSIRHKGRTSGDPANRSPVNESPDSELVNVRLHQ